MCDGEIITIDWGYMNCPTEYITYDEYGNSGCSVDVVRDNNADYAIYGSDVRTPVKAEYRPGQVFRGWRFNK